jgi:hypothetical protein
MREVTVRIEFISHCLGNVRRTITENGKEWPVFYLPRLKDQVRFEATWWAQKMRFAAQILNKHHRLVKDIAFDLVVDGRASNDVEQFFKRYTAKTNFVRHECFAEGTVIGVNCVVPDDISDNDLWQLMETIGKYKGISPYGHNEYGHFTVISVATKNKGGARGGPQRNQKRPATTNRASESTPAKSVDGVVDLQQDKVSDNLPREKRRER